MSTNTFELDTLRLLLSVTDQATQQPKDLTGASVVAVIKRPGAVAFDGNATILDGPTGKIKIEFSPETFTATRYLIQVRVTDASGDTQTIYNSDITAARSLVIGEGPTSS